MVPATRKRLLHWAGSGLAVLGAGFVVARLVSYAHQINVSRLAPGTLLALTGLAAVYGAANLLLALAWRDVLRHLGVLVDARWAVRTHGVTQLAKYVPGNIFHLAGRQAIGQAAGLPALALVKSTAWELGLISFAGSWFATLAAVVFWPRASVALALAAFTAVAGSAILVADRRVGPGIARCLGRHLLFLCISGGVFAGVLWLVAPPERLSATWALGVCGASVVAWLAGLLTPGAPAGVGVREIVLLALLRTAVPEAGLLTAIVLGRIVTVTGDVLYYFSAGALARRPPVPASSGQGTAGP